MNQTIYLGGGCFWCVEAIFQRVPGVTALESGYSGGDYDTATYAEVSTGATKHVETVRVDFDDERIILDQILLVFFKTHDPTSLNQQGADKGPQYKSIVYTTSEDQLTKTVDFVEKLERKNIFTQPIVTEVVMLKNFYKAEEYHQDFYNQNPDYGYCSTVINPKLAKLETLLKSELS